MAEIQPLSDLAGYRIIGDSFADVQEAVDQLISAPDVMQAYFDVPRRVRNRLFEQWVSEGTIERRAAVPA